MPTPVTPVRVGVVCDLRDEGWHSMDLVADMLLDVLPVVAGGNVEATRLRPAMVRRWTRLPVLGRTARAHFGDRLMSRLWDYPRWLTPRASGFDVFHIVDHSYAHLVRALPPARTIVTCHDLDAIQAALPNTRARLNPAGLLARHVLNGLQRAAHVACVSHATKAQLLATGAVGPERVSVVYEGVHPSCSPAPYAPRDQFRREQPEILHVGSTIARKRIDILLKVFAGVRKKFPRARLIRVGGPMASEHRALARQLDIEAAITEMPFLERGELAALYRRASVVVLPSDREGFGLPVAEAMACGAPVVASAIPALQEVGGTAASYCPPADVPAWIAAITALLQEEQDDPQARAVRQQRLISTAARFNWTTYATEMVKLYELCGAQAR